MITQQDSPKPPKAARYAITSVSSKNVQTLLLPPQPFSLSLFFDRRTAKVKRNPKTKIETLNNLSDFLPLLDQ